MYPERKPIYDAYKLIIQEIIKEKKYKYLAESEINALNNSILSAFKEIGQFAIMEKAWPSET
jgi:hypothetical protein